MKCHGLLLIQERFNYRYGIGRIKPHKPHGNFLCQSLPSESAESHVGVGFIESPLFYMGVSLNGGTPKTPQNDHF